MDKMSKEALTVKRAEQALDRKRRTLGLFGGPVLAVLVFMTPIAGLTLAAHKLLAIMVLVALWWITIYRHLPGTTFMLSSFVLKSAGRTYLIFFGASRFRP